MVARLNFVSSIARIVDSLHGIYVTGVGIEPRNSRLGFGGDLI